MPANLEENELYLNFKLPTSNPRAVSAGLFNPHEN